MSRIEAWSPCLMRANFLLCTQHTLTMWAHGGGQRKSWVLCSIIHHFILLRQGLWLTLEQGQQAASSRDVLVSTSHSTEVKDMCGPHPIFSMGVRDLNLCPHAYQVIRLPPASSSQPLVPILMTVFFLFIRSLVPTAKTTAFGAGILCEL